jgi:hypothetical protein
MTKTFCAMALSRSLACSDRRRPAFGSRRWLAGGAGMSEVLHESMLEALVTQGRSGATDQEAETAPIKLDTIIMADPGTTIRGEDIYNLIQAAARRASRRPARCAS